MSKEANWLPTSIGIEVCFTGKRILLRQFDVVDDVWDVRHYPSLAAFLRSKASRIPSVEQAVRAAIGEPTKSVDY